MGSTEGAAAAGQIAVRVFTDSLRRSGDTLTPHSLRSAIAQAQVLVNAEGARLGHLTGCTLTALLPITPEIPGEGWIVHIGDSRIYRLRSGLLELLTVDHTLAWLGAVYGWYPADSPQAAQARYHLLRYVGHPACPEPDILAVSLLPRDVYCVCTDGLAEQITYPDLHRRLASSDATATMVDGLLAAADAAGGRDNATVAILRVNAPASPNSA